MARSIPWPRILAEGLAIVVSILLAFGIQAWWEERGRSTNEEIVLGGLLQDLREDSIDYADFAARQHQRVLAADLLLGLADDAVGRAEGAEKARQRGMTAGQAFELLGLTNRLETVLVSYDEIEAGGGSSMIGDPALRRQVASYYGLARDRADINDALRPELLRFRELLGNLGYAYSDEESIPVETVLSEPPLRAQIRTMRGTAARAWDFGVEMETAASRLIELVGHRVE